MAKDPYKSKEFEAFVRHTLDTMLPNMQASEVVVSLLPTKDKADVKAAVELGFALMLDKPIIVFANNDQPIPARLAKIADRIIYGDMKNDLESMVGELRMYIDEKKRVN